MGITSWLKNKAQETVRNIQAERAYNKEQKLERRDQYDKGYKEGQYKRGIAEGSGQVVPAAKQATGGGRYVYKPPKGDFFTGGMGGGGSFGDSFWGAPERTRQAPPMETVKVSKSGGVTIHRPIQPQRPAQAQEDPYDFWRLSGVPAGAAGANRKNKERDYDPILG